MFETVRRWLSSGSGDTAQDGLAAIEAWATRAGMRFRKTPELDRFLIETTSRRPEMRMEWGPSQRSYIDSHELRIRMDLNLPGSFQMLVLTQPLMERLEAETFERYTQDAQTMIDMSTPEEMRWLAIFPKVDLSWSKVLRSRFCSLGADPDLVRAWIQGGLGEQLERASEDFLRGDPPFVLITMRGKLYLRLQLSEPTPAVLTQCLELFDAALKSAVAMPTASDAGSTEWGTTQTTEWQTQIPPSESPDAAPR
jgi:hypothetical protein